tara:strand:+ start:2680 stop:4314 length:1635 start_codon:yes stop_codon:yes gene_type:complete
MVSTRIKVHQAMKDRRQVWDTRWQKLSEWFSPHQAHITNKSEPADNSHRVKLHDTKSIEAVSVLTQGHMSFITPLNERWFNFTPNARQAGGDDVDGWFAECSKLSFKELQNSNFYVVAQQVYKDRTEKGTGCMFVRKGRKRTLSFEYVPIATYVFSEDEDGNADMLAREIMLSAPDAVKRFGKEKMGPKVLEACEQFENGKGEGKKFTFIHTVEPRLEYDKTKTDKINMPYSSHYDCVEDQMEIDEGGFEEFPYVVSRYEKWDDELWGFSPAYNALPNVLSVNWLKKLVKLSGEVAVNPRLLLLAGEKANVDLRAGGVTYVSQRSAQAQLPREWGTSSDFRAAEYLIGQDHDQIDKFFHVNLFRMFSDLDKQMTATEIGAREREKLLMFAPSFVQFAFDMGGMMTRLFNIIAREGLFPDPPESMVDDEGLAYVETPEVSYQSKVALAIQQLANDSFDRVMGRVLPIIEVVPNVLDNFDFDTMIRDLARNEGMNDKWIVKIEQMKELRDERAEAQQQQMQMEQAEQATKAMSNVGVTGEQAMEAM